MFDFANTPITENITLYPKWVASYTVLLVGATNKIGEDTEQYVAQGGYADVPPEMTMYDEMEQAGYKINAWYETYDDLDSAFSNQFNFANTQINADTTLYGEWVYDPDYPIPMVTVRFETQDVPYGSGADNPIEDEVAVGTWLSKPDPDPENSGYTLDCWCYDAELTNPIGDEDWASIQAYDNTTFYAKWVAVI